MSDGIVKQSPRKQARVLLKDLELKQPFENALSSAETDYAKVAIEAFQRSELNTTIYAAACFTPVLGILSTVTAISEFEDSVLNVLTFSSLVILGMAGLYFAMYRTFFLGVRRMGVEGYLLGLIPNYSFKLAPQGIWSLINRFFVFSVPIGYVIVALVAHRILFL